MNPVVRRAYFESFQQKKAKATRANKNLPAVIWSGWRVTTSAPRPRTLANSVVIAMRLLVAIIIRAALKELEARMLILGLGV